MADPSPLLVYGFLTLMVVTLAVFFAGVRASAQSEDAGGESGRPTSETVSTTRVMIGVLAWLTITGAAGFTGLTARWELRPPPVMVLAFLGFALTFVVARSRLGTQVATRLPIAALIAFQAFRFPLEMLLHLAYTDGVMPIQMSYSGYNFDILSGLGGLVVGGFYLLRKQAVPRALAWAYNIMGLGLLINIVGIAIASMPLLAAFGPDKVNLWVGEFPFVWLPAIFVTLALFGHLTLTRRLLAEARAQG